MIEANSQHVEGGLGYNTDVGPRLEARYGNMDIFDTAWRFRSALRLDSKIQDLRLNFDSPPRPGAVWDSYFAQAKEQDIQDELTRQLAVGISHNFGAGPTPAAPDRLGPLRRPAHRRAGRRHALRDLLRRARPVAPHRRAGLAAPGYVLGIELGGTPDMLSSRQFVRGIASGTLFFPVGRYGDLVLRGQAGARAVATRARASRATSCSAPAATRRCAAMPSRASA